MKTHYDVLNVSRTSSLEEIKTSYRALAKKLHPDANVNLDSNSLDLLKVRFSEVQTAYNLLKDPLERRRYDEELLKKNKSSDKTYESSYEELEVDLEDIYFGGWRTFYQRDICQTCEGLGVNSKSTCSKCGGKGEISEIVSKVKVVKICSCCHGKGIEDLEDCSDCKGSGEIIKNRFDILLEKGSDSGSLTVDKAGRTFKIKVKKHNRFERSGLDLIFKAFDAKDFIFVERLDETKIKVNIPASVETGGYVRVKGQGLKTDSGLTGDLIIQV